MCYLPNCFCISLVVFQAVSCIPVLSTVTRPSQSPLFEHILVTFRFSVEAIAGEIQDLISNLRFYSLPTWGWTT